VSDKHAVLEGVIGEAGGRNKKIAPVKCPIDTCRRYTPRSLEECFYCGTPIDPEAGTNAKDAAIALDAEVSDLWTKLVQMATSGEIGVEDAEFADIVATIAEQDPAMISDLTDLIEALKDGDPDAAD
jgi:wyosine [tRNA(Phe)-imidazoG37] synthetase (radical SAM superfamily)